MVWYSHLFQNSPQFIVIHTVKGFGIVNEAEIDVFLELSCFFNDPADIGNLIGTRLPYSKAKFVCYSRCFLISYFCIPVPYSEKDILLLCLLRW